MHYLVAKGAKLRCSHGTDHSNLHLPRRPYSAQGEPLAHVRDNLPSANIPPFGMCRTLCNPMVLAATNAAGQLTPMPCVPPQFTKWQPGSACVFQEVGSMRVAALTDNSICVCQWTGVVTITDPNTRLVDRTGDGAQPSEAGTDDAAAQEASKSGDAASGPKNGSTSSDSGTRAG
jgi:uncharacterized protein DUF4280